jgi:hypothetical protein
LQEASRRLREAAFLANENPEVQAAFLSIHNEEHRSPLLDLCRRYALYHDKKAGEEAAKFLRSSEATNVNGNALECFQLILESNSATLSPSQDAVIASLANLSLPVRQYIARELQASTTEFFDNVYERGDDAANCLRSIVLDQSLWSNEDARLHVEDELFQLFLAKLMETGHDHDGRALKGIALLLIADTQRLHSFVDEEGFDALLTSLDFRLPPEVRGQATLVLSKLLEADQDAGQQYFSKFVVSKIAKSKGDALIEAFSAAAQVFSLAPAITAQLFLTEGFLRSILPLLEHQFSTTMVHDSFLALLNAACMDGACRNAIAQFCSPWLSHKVSNGKGKQPSMAATILAKLRTSGAKPADQKAVKAEDDVSELVELFTKTLALEEGRNISDSIEGLAYTSLKSDVKERLANDKAFLKQLLQALDENANIPEIVVGGLSILSNLSHFPPNMSEEQKKINQLKAYANASKPTDPSPLEDEDHIKARCASLVEAGVMPTLVRLNKSASTATTQLTDQILLSLTRNQKDRGKMAQQGAVKLLVSHAQKSLQTKSDSTPPNTDAAHALARTLISLNPAHVFASTTPHITDAIPPLINLIKTPQSTGMSDQPRDLLPLFESLLALTNLASSPDPTAATSIIRSAWDDIEDILLNDNVLLRRAACELICNLTPFPPGAAKFADGSQRSKQRLHILIAMADVEDLPTRRAAGGALAMLSEHDSVIPAILDLKRGAEIVLDLCGDEEDEGIMHRGLVVLRNVVCAEGENGVRGTREVVKAGGMEKVKTALRRSKNQDILALGVEVLKVLVEEEKKQQQQQKP